jgi:hypothetical protein
MMGTSEFAAVLLATAVLSAVLLTAPVAWAGSEKSHVAHAGHSHKHEMREAEGPAPKVTLKAIEDTGGGYNLHLVTENFRFSPENTGTATDAVEGHAHLYVNGVKKARVYGAWFHLPGDWLTEGENSVVMTLNDNVHNHWAAEGERVASELVLTKAETFEGTLIERTLGAGDAQTIVVAKGGAVRLVFHMGEATDLHLHGYDLTGTAAPGTPALFTFDADHTGRFAVVAHDDEGVLGRKEVPLAYIEVRSK